MQERPEGHLLPRVIRFSTAIQELRVLYFLDPNRIGIQGQGIRNLMINGPGGRLNAVLDALGPHSVALRHEVPAGTLLLRQDAPVSTVYLIEHGIVKLARCEADGDCTGVGLRYPGWLVGAAAAVLDLPTPAEARTLTPGTLRIIPASVVIQKLRTDLQFAWLITECSVVKCTSKPARSPRSVHCRRVSACCGCCPSCRSPRRHRPQRTAGPRSNCRSDIATSLKCSSAPRKASAESLLASNSKVSSAGTTDRSLSAPLPIARSRPRLTNVNACADLRQ